MRFVSPRHASSTARNFSCTSRWLAERLTALSRSIWQRVGLVERVGMQRLRAAQHCSEPLQGHARDVVVWLLRGERYARRLRVRAKHHADGLASAELVAHDPRVDAPRRAELGDLLEEV